MVESVARSSPDAVAMVIDGVPTSYAALVARSGRVAAALVGVGVGPGDDVATLVPSCREIVEVLVAASTTGAVFVPFNFRCRSAELEQVLADCRPAVVVVDDDPGLEVNRADLLRDVIGPWDPDDGSTAPDSPARTTFGIRRVVRLPRPGESGGDTYDALVGDGTTSESGAEVVGAPRDGPLAMIYTSGTSATPKGVLVPEAALTVRQAAIAHRLGVRSGDHVFSPLPLFHIAGYIPLLSALSVGATYVTNRYFDAELACATIARHGCRVAWSGFDTVLRSIIEASEAGAGSLDSLEVDAVIGPPPALQALEARLSSCRLLLIYGATELGSAATLPAPEDDLAARTETAGYELEGTTLVVLDPLGHEVPTGETGEICGRGPAVALGYHASDGAVARTGFDPEGWFHSGDLGRRRDDGRIEYVSRLKDLIKVGGENVAAAEIEEFLIRHPDVYEVQVVGVPDTTYGEVPVAFVQPAPGGSCDEAALRAHCACHLSRFRLPREIIFLTEDEWPRSATKIRKNDLREMYMARTTPPDVRGPNPQEERP